MMPDDASRTFSIAEAVPFALEPRSQSSFVSRIMLTSSYKAMLSNLVPIPFCYSVTE